VLLLEPGDALLSPAGPDVFTSVSHAPSDRPVFSLRLSRQFVTNATLGCTL